MSSRPVHKHDNPICRPLWLLTGHAGGCTLLLVLIGNILCPTKGYVSMIENRRDFLETVAALGGGLALLPWVSACGDDDAPPASDPLAIPLVKPANWNALEFNRTRGNAGAIPISYQNDINGADGDTQHLGKHLPYVPLTSGVPVGYIAIMWGDPAKGHAKHPNAVRSPSNNNEGHWYDWIRIVKAEEDATGQLQSNYSEWPDALSTDNGDYGVLGGGSITADSGKNTIYFAALPSNVQTGDTVRIWAHCLTHGEYVDFLTL